MFTALLLRALCYLFGHLWLDLRGKERTGMQACDKRSARLTFTGQK